MEVSVRILHAMSGHAFGEVERAFEYTVSALNDFNVTQKLVIKSNPDRAKRLSSIGMPPLELPIKPRFDFSSKKRLYLAIENFDPDIVVSWTSDVSFFLCEIKRNHIAYVNKDFALYKYESCKHLFSLNSQRTEPAVQSGWPRNRISVMPPIILPNKMEPIDRQRFFTPNRSIVAILIGPLPSDEGIENLMKAIARLSGVYFWILGDGKHMKNLELMAREEGIKPRTRFITWSKDAASVVSASDIVVCPSKKDFVGVQVLEGWAQKKPVVACDSVGPGLLITHNEDGLLVPIDDVSRFSQAIKLVKDDKVFAKKIGEEGYNKFSQTYSPEITVPQYLNLFSKVISYAKS